MVDIFEEIDYRKILKDFYQQRKSSSPLFSYRMMGKKLGMDGSQLFRVLQQEQHLPSRCVPAVKEMIGLIGREAEYFDFLVAAARTRVPSKRKELLNKAYTLRDVERKAVDKSELKYLSNWWIPAIRSYLEVSGGLVNFAEISERLIPKVSVPEVKEAFEILFELGFIKRLPSGKYGLSQSHLTISGPEKSAAVRKFQKQAMSLGMSAIDGFSVDKRDVSTLTISVDNDCFEDLRELAREFRRQVQKRVEESVTPDRVLQLTMSIFPLVLPVGEA